ncbi:uncharacterized protein LOC126987909 [Eriocheir sinensis]|uniref:uncharacterized protein LOC126987909 n=1 Tax=Eriocheir sinensis TaxID=95602 RepID=UPI0021C6657F|nr:uncharacterized protein LOC126987909 [Eriocheir sinensis]XP_050701456.1 uncharacterized protein LOC126987909 [Eriocheir sinensis]XP_050701467.1 uncharacterized protein LOC126987909 [Eriocheir sinensis]
MITSRTFYLLLLLAPHGVLLTSRTRKLHVTFIRPDFPTVKIKADCDPSLDPMTFEVYKCPMNGDTYDPQSWWISGVCKKDGAKHCLTQGLRDKECFAISGHFGENDTLRYTSSELSLANVTFLSRNFTVEPTSWKQQGNTSVLRLKPVPGVPIYTLILKDANKNDNCIEVTLTGDTEGSPGEVVFTAHWHQQVIPGCTYIVLFEPTDDCGGYIGPLRSKTLPMLQYTQPSKEVILVEELKNGELFVAEVGSAALLTLVVMMLLFVVIHHARKSRRIPSEPQRPTPVTRRETSPSPRPAVLMVYAPSLRPQMAALAARLKEMTGLQIDDLHDVGDQDKLNDPTVWVTRRLVDPNTRFVLACSTDHHDNTETRQELQGGAIHFLLDDFLQHLRSSSLAYDYARLHLVSFENEPQVEVRDVTPGRVYQLPAHLPQLAQNLTLATPSTTSSPSDTLSASC